MIFVSVGTHPQPFTRLLNEVAELVDQKIIQEEVIVQCGNTLFFHEKMNIFPFMDIETFERTLAKSRVLITHAGEGNIGTALQMGKPMIIVPRLHKFGEHTNNHQLELANAIAERGDAIIVNSILDWNVLVKKALSQKPKNETGYVMQAIRGFAREFGIEEKSSMKKKAVPTTASIVVATLNGGEPLIRAVKGMLEQNFNGKYEIIVVDDGSFDGKTPALLEKNFEKNPKIKIVFLTRSGVCKARNAGIRASKYEIVINMDHDCISQKDWLQTMVNGFDSPSVGAVSAYGHYGGTSTGFRKDILEHLQGYDEDFFYYREDTDLSFRVMELGFEYKRLTGGKKYHEDRTLVTPKGFSKILRYTHQRLRYHMNDVLLHKKHQTKRCNEFLHVKGKFFVNPVQDFKVATGLWENDEKEFALSSPRGLTFLKNESFFHFLAIVLLGLGYTFAVKGARLAGSIKHGHILL